MDKVLESGLQKATIEKMVSTYSDVHHILPLSSGDTHIEDKLMALCTHCHSAIIMRDGDRWHRRQRDNRF